MNDRPEQHRARRSPLWWRRRRAEAGELPTPVDIPDRLRATARRLGLPEVSTDPGPPDAELTVCFRGKRGEAHVTVHPTPADPTETYSWFDREPTEGPDAPATVLHLRDRGRAVDVRLVLHGAGPDDVLAAARELGSATLT